MVTPAVASVRTTLKLLPTFCPPTFWMVTPTEAVLPCVTELGALTLVTAMSVTGGASTSMPIPTLLFAGLASASFCVANRVGPLSAAPAVFQLNVSVALAPTASPGIVCVPSTALPYVPSVSTTSKLGVTSWPPTFCTVTTTWAVSPRGTRPGAVMPVMARSVAGEGGGGGGGCPDGAVTSIPIPMLLFDALSSASCCVAKRVCPVIAAPAVFQRRSTVADVPTATPATAPVPRAGPAHPAVSTTAK